MENTLTNFYNLLLQNHQANFNQTLHRASIGEGIQVCSNEGFSPFPRGDNNEIAKIHWQIYKIFFSRTTGPISTNLPQSIIGCRGFKSIQMKGFTLFQGEIFTKLQKYIDEFKSSSPEPLGQFQPNLAQIILEWRKIKFIKWRTPPFSKGRWFRNSEK